MQERDIDALAAHWAIRCVQGVPFGETLSADVSVLTELAGAVLNRGEALRKIKALNAKDMDDTFRSIEMDEIIDAALKGTP